MNKLKMTLLLIISLCATQSSHILSTPFLNALDNLFYTAVSPHNNLTLDETSKTELQKTKYLARTFLEAQFFSLRKYYSLIQAITEDKFIDRVTTILNDIGRDDLTPKITQLIKEELKNQKNLLAQTSAIPSHPWTHCIFNTKTMIYLGSASLLGFIAGIVMEKFYTQKRMKGQINTTKNKLMDNKNLQ